MDRQLDGKAAIVTGAAGDVGRAIVGRFLEAGALVMATDFDEASLSRQLAEISSDGSRLVSRRHDVTSETDWQAVVAATLEAFGRLDVLVNCAGTIKVELLEALSLDDWRRVHAVNLDGPFLGMKSVLPALREAAKTSPGGASVINVASAQGFKAGQPGLCAYTSSKGGLRLLTKNAAVEFGRLGYNVRCNVLIPSAMTGTAMMNRQVQLQVEKGVFKSFKQGISAISAVFPIGHAGEPIDIAHAAAFLASDEAKHITGIDLPVDGGICA